MISGYLILLSMWCTVYLILCHILGLCQVLSHIYSSWHPHEMFIDKKIDKELLRSTIRWGCSPWILQSLSGASAADGFLASQSTKVMDLS